MPHGERDATPRPAWLRVVAATVSRRAVTLVMCLALLLALAAAAVVLFVPRAQREPWVFEAALTHLRSVPPTDAIIAQLPPERLESVRSRGLAQISRLLTPALLAFSVLVGVGAIAYAQVARRLRGVLSTWTLRPVSAVRWPAHAPLIFSGIAVAGLLVHIPYALQSVRFDEDFAGVYATSSWFAWANNLSGYQNHVAALLTIRISTALFGLNELSIRAPAILISSLSLALFCTYLWSRFSATVALLTAALFTSLPLWAEQTTLARGYGVSFCGATLIVLGLLRMQDEGSQPSSATMFSVFGGVLFGSLAHAFFVFFVVGLFAFVACTRQLSPQLRFVALWWLFLAGFLPAVSMAVGLPGTLTVVKQTGHTPVLAVAQRFVEELTFRREGFGGMLLMSLWLLALISSALALPARARTPYLFLLACAVIGPILGSAAYVYPRYYLHTLALTVPCVAWFVSTRVLRQRVWATAALVAALVGVWASTQPWNQLPLVDLRTGAELARREARVYGERFAIDTFLVNGMRFYNGSTGRIANSTHPLPEDVQRLLMPVPHAAQGLPEGFAIERRIDGAESDLLLLTRQSAFR